MKRIDKEFVLSDSSVNCYGFRLLTQGYIIEEFKKNPIGYYMHGREGGILLKWDNVQIRGDKIVGYPNINPSHPRANQTIDEINNGYLNAASVGHIVVIESDDSPALKLPGQTLPTITKWFNRECSIVDIPGNSNALALFNVKGDIVDLNLFAKTSNVRLSANEPEDNLDIDQMLNAAVKSKDITAEQAKLLKENYQNDARKLNSLLKEFAQMRIDYLMSLTWQELDKEALLDELKEKYLQGFQQKFYLAFGKEHNSAINIKKNKNVIDDEIERLAEFVIKNGDETAEMVGLWKDNFKANPEKLKKILEEAPQKRIDYLMSLTWRELDKGNLLEELKRKYLQGFKEKYRDQFSVEYNDKK
ncbi:MAG: hypothetical protein ABIN97_20890 [Ginsengibacter sp.]